MLIEILCEKFKADGTLRPTIRFHKGLNVILGDNFGSNSIGKTTFLYIIDFVFGGTSYISKSIDTQEHIGTHTIKFAFKFKGDIFYFSRNSVENQVVSVCNENYEQKSQISLQDYCLFLKKYYGLMQNDLTFREATSRFFRIYQKGNTNERNPLEAVHNESAQKSIKSLLKIFDLYTELQKLSCLVEEAKEKLITYKNAIKFNFIQTINTKRELEKKEAKLVLLKTARDNYTDPAELKNRTTEELKKILGARTKLRLLRAKKSKIESSLSRIIDNIKVQRTDFKEDFTELQSLFPSITLQSISDIEEFHKKIAVILSDELLQEQERLEIDLKDIQAEIKQEESILDEYDIPTGISKKILSDFSNLQQQINSIEEQKNNYEQTSNLKNTYENYRRQYIDCIKQYLLKVQTKINDEMKSLNDFIYEKCKKSPILSLRESSYDFITPDDLGTGTSYKSLIVFDIAVLKLTVIPALIHDSFILKNIADSPLEKILEIYAQSDKQIFIAMDKATSYSEKANRILNDSTVLSLSNNGKELFGFSWGNVLK